MDWKCQDIIKIFIRGFDTVIDDKYHTPEKQEFKDACALGMYVHTRAESRTDDPDKINFYLNSYCRDRYGSNVPEVFVSYRSQIHRYGFICEESDEYAKYVKQGNGGKGNFLTLPTECALYHVSDSIISYAPAFAVKAEILRSGPHVFHIHRIIGKWTKHDVDGVPELFKKPEEEWKKHFNDMLLVKV